MQFLGMGLRERNDRLYEEMDERYRRDHAEQEPERSALVAFAPGLPAERRLYLVHES